MVISDGICNPYSLIWIQLALDLYYHPFLHKIQFIIISGHRSWLKLLIQEADSSLFHTDLICIVFLKSTSFHLKSYYSISKWVPEYVFQLMKTALLPHLYVSRNKFNLIQICHNYLSSWKLLIIKGNYLLKKSLPMFWISNHSTSRPAGRGHYWDWSKQEGAEAPGLSSGRLPKRLMKSQIVFNQTPSLPDRNHTATQRVQEQERCILNILPALGLSVTN